MPWPARLASLFRSARRPSSNYWMTVPIHRLTYLLLAIFCMFGMVGCFVDLLALGEHPLPFVMVWTIFSGALAAAGIFTGFRAPTPHMDCCRSLDCRLAPPVFRNAPLPSRDSPSQRGTWRTNRDRCLYLSKYRRVCLLHAVYPERRSPRNSHPDRVGHRAEYSADAGTYR